MSQFNERLLALLRRDDDQHTKAAAEAISRYTQARIEHARATAELRAAYLRATKDL